MTNRSLEDRAPRRLVERIGLLWDEGVESGDAGPVDFEELKAEAEARLRGLRKGGNAPPSPALSGRRSP